MNSAETCEETCEFAKTWRWKWENCETGLSGGLWKARRSLRVKRMGGRGGGGYRWAVVWVSLFKCASMFVKSFLKCCACKPRVCVCGVVAVHNLSFVHHILNLTFPIKRTGSKSTRTVAARRNLNSFFLFYFPVVP